MIKNKKINKVKRTLFNMKIRANRRLFTSFSNKYKFLYFGVVDQTTDEHKVVRGFTVSSTHNDNHYCVGSTNGYNATIVNRCDAVWHNKKNKTRMNDWLIVAIDLQTEKNVPHFLVQPNNHDSQLFNIFFSLFPNMHNLNSYMSDTSNNEFSSRFSIFAKPDNIQEIKKIFIDEITKVLGAHFWPLAIELHNNVLYVYSIDTKTSVRLLETMLKNGLWLAKKIDLMYS